VGSGRNVISIRVGCTSLENPSYVNSEMMFPEVEGDGEGSSAMAREAAGNLELWLMGANLKSSNEPPLPSAAVFLQAAYFGRWSTGVSLPLVVWHVAVRWWQVHHYRRRSPCSHLHHVHRLADVATNPNSSFQNIPRNPA
jgi:hypothetical protein